MEKSQTNNVLLITSPFRPNIGGVETHLDDLINAANEKGFVFDVITYQPLVTQARGRFIEKYNGNTIVRVPWPRFNLFLRLERLPAFEFIYLFPGIFLGSLMYMVLNAVKIRAIHTQGLAAGFSGLVLGKLFKKKVIISTHSIYNFPPKGLYRNFTKYMFNNSDAILTLSEQSKREVINLGISEEKVHVFTYWVDQNIFKPLDKKAKRNEMGLDTNAFAILFVGRMVEVKGIKQLLKAASMDINNLYLFAGAGPLEVEVENYSKANKNIVYLGSFANEDLAGVYNASDCLVIPSQNDEGFGRVILEALSCGIPVIGAKRGAIPEALTGGVGVLIEPEPDEIVKAVNYFKKNKKTLNRMSKKAVSFANKKYSKENVQQIIKFY